MPMCIDGWVETRGRTPSGHAADRLAVVVTLNLALASFAAVAQEVHTPAGEAYRIGPEDRLLWKNDPALSGPVPVRPDGKISLPLLNDVQAAGLTALELRDVSPKSLRSLCRAPRSP